VAVEAEPRRAVLAALALMGLAMSTLGDCNDSLC
jgi:hypothetical protein